MNHHHNSTKLPVDFQLIKIGYYLVILGRNIKKKGFKISLKPLFFCSSGGRIDGSSARALSHLAYWLVTVIVRAKRARTL